MRNSYNFMGVRVGAHMVFFVEHIIFFFFVKICVLLEMPHTFANPSFEPIR